MMVSFCAVQNVLDEILDLIESVSRDFPAYSVIPNRSYRKPGKLLTDGVDDCSMMDEEACHILTVNVFGSGQITKVFLRSEKYFFKVNSALRKHTCDTSQIIREAPGNGADLPDSRKGCKTSRKLNIPITIFFQNCPFFARIYGTDLKQQTVKGLTS